MRVNFKNSFGHRMAVFESIDEVVARLNGAIIAEEITRKVLNVQTLACTATQDWQIDSGSFVSNSWVGNVVYLLRVFYVLEPIHEEEVGLAGFVPQCLEGGLFRKPKFESQSCLLRKASKWLSENPEINFCSAMSLDVKLKSMVSIDTKRMSVTRETGDFIRILRIAYTKPRELSADIPISSTLPPPPPVYLEHQVYVSHKDYSMIKHVINDFMGRDEWRTAQETYKWLLLSCETVPVFANNGLKTSLGANSDQSFQALLSSNHTLCSSEYYALILYYDVGYYGIDHLGYNANSLSAYDIIRERPVGCHRYQRDIPDIFDRHDDDVVTFDEDLPAPEDCRLTAIIDFANNWLQKREVWGVISCETVGAIIRVKFSKGGTVTYKKLLTTYSINDEGILSQWGVSYDTLISEGTACFRVKLLRLWVRPFDSSEFNDKVRPIVPQIQFRDLEPRILDSSSNRFESIDEVVARLNGAINAEEITGKILNCHSGLGDDSQTNVSDPWVGRIVYVLRVFYILGPIHEEEVGLADFVPQYLEGGVFRKPKFESQSCVLRKASKWLSENPEINFCSAMSLDVKLKSMVSIDTKRMSVTRGTGDFIRILRIAYTKPREVSADIPISSTLPPPPPVYLEHRVFVLHKDYSEIKYAINDFMGRDEWLTTQETYKWLLLSCETVPVFANNSLKSTLEKNSDQSFQTLLSSKHTLCSSEAVIDFANNWLQEREVWDVISCETVGAIIEVAFSKGGTVTYKKLLTTYSTNNESPLRQWADYYDTFIYEKTICFRVKMLRLWLRPFDSPELNDKMRPIVPQIQFRDFEPRILDSSSNRFESIDEVVARLN
ncbi:unnamed protein product, partial [Oppiella nova]